MKKIIKKVLKKVSLKNKLYVLNLTTMIDAIIEAGYREDMAWESSEDDRICIISKQAKKLTKKQLKLIKRYV